MVANDGSNVPMEENTPPVASKASVPAATSDPSESANEGGTQPDSAGRRETAGQHPARGQGKNRKGTWDKRDGKRHKKNSTRRERIEEAQERKRRKVDEDGTAVAAGDDDGEKQQKRGGPHEGIPFSTEEIAAEERRPKRKVAVMVGYAGTGYRGMQINPGEKTIEGDLFAAFVAAGAISKANADDPKKSSLVRCARTDKGVHAAGNVISLKLIIEDEGIVQKINDSLPPQIRVWGIQRTNNAFSCYQTCDSRWYEYLLPSYSLLPPHPDSFLGKKILEAAREKGVYDELMERLDDTKDYWAEVEKNDVEPILSSLDAETRKKVLDMLHASDEFRAQGPNHLGDIVEEAPSLSVKDAPAKEKKTSADDHFAPADAEPEDHKPAQDSKAPETAEATGDTAMSGTGEEKEPAPAAKPRKPLSPAEEALRAVKAAYIAAKRRYRVTPARLRRLQDALSQYVGTHNFHNYTIQKSARDASAKRHIKSFVVNPEPIQIRDTQWLSLKVHGQSFMMHQIRKMVGMAVMLARCGADPAVVAQTYEARRISVPKAPSLGLLLERPVFDNYNARALGSYGKEPIDFDNYEREMRAFKDREIYARMWDQEEKENVFHSFFHQLDNFETDFFLWATPLGIEAAYERNERGEKVPEELQAELGNEDGNPDEGEG